MKFTVTLVLISIVIICMSCSRDSSLENNSTDESTHRHSSSNSFDLSVHKHAHIPANKWFSPPKDKDGHTPADVVMHFINLMHDARYKEAKTLWIMKDTYKPKPTDFEAYCKKMEDLKISDIDHISGGKSGYCHVFFKRGQLQEKGIILTHYSLKQINEEWMISRRFHW